MSILDLSVPATVPLSSLLMYVQLTVSVISSYPLTAPICDLGGVLDVIAVREDLPQVPVEAVDVRLSDHRLSARVQSIRQ